MLISCGDDITPSDPKRIEDGTKIILSPEEYISIAYDDPGEISEDQILQTASNFARNLNQSPDSRSSAPSLSIKGKYYYSSDGTQSDGPAIESRFGGAGELQSLVYEIEVEDGDAKSLAIVSGDERTPNNVVYFGPCLDESQDIETNGNIAIMMAMGKGSIVGEIRRVENIKDSLREKTIEKISRELEVPVGEIKFEEVKDLISVESNPNSIYTNPYDGYQEEDLGTIRDRFGPVSPLMWGQGDFYNNEMPIKKYYPNGVEKHAYAGCANVAIGQIFAMLGVQNLKGKKNDGTVFNINTDSLRNIHYLSDPDGYMSNTTKADADMVSGFLRWLADETQSKYKTKMVSLFKHYYTSTSTSDTNIKNMLGRYTTYTENAKGSFFNSVDAQRSLLRNCPLLVGGPSYLKDSSTGAQKDKSDHAFIIDGLYTVLAAISPVTSYKYYFHVNLGETRVTMSYVTNRPAFFQTNPDNVDKFEIVYQQAQGILYINSDELWTLFNIAKK